MTARVRGYTPVSAWPAYALITALLARGLINLVSVGPFYPATLATDLLVMFMALRVLLLVLEVRGRIRIPGWCAAILGLFVVYGWMFLYSPESLAIRAIALRDQIGYMVVAPYVYLLVRDGRSGPNLIKFLMWLGRALALFGIAQWMMAGRLPDYLMASADTVVFGYYGTGIARSNGLIGNTIVFGAAMTLLFALQIARWLHRPTKIELVWTLVFILAIVSTFSRVAIVGVAGTALFCVALVWAAQGAGKVASAAVLLPTAGTALVVFIGPLVASALGSTFLVRELFLGQNESVRRSNDGHALDIRVARDVFAEHPIFGTGLGTHSVGSEYGNTHLTIADGAMWARLAEGGLLLAVPYALVLVVIIVTCARGWRNAQAGWLSVGLAAFLTYELVVASLVNSAFFGKVPFLMSWVVLGLALGSRRVTDVRESALVQTRAANT